MDADLRRQLRREVYELAFIGTMILVAVGLWAAVSWG
jgi:hypothetical protein